MLILVQSGFVGAGVRLNSPHNYLLPYFTEHFSLSLLEKVRRSRKGVKEIQGGLLAVLSAVLKLQYPKCSS